MNKILSLLLFGLLFANISFAVADEASAPQNVPVSEQVPKEEDFNFNDSAYYLTDEQLQDAKEIDDIEDKSTGFIQKIINSSHFSSNTATKTYIPINKIQN